MTVSETTIDCWISEMIRQKLEDKKAIKESLDKCKITKGYIDYSNFYEFYKKYEIKNKKENFNKKFYAELGIKNGN